MFTINYEFQDGGPLYKCSYPKKEYSDHNIFFIRGKNDGGKTTTLNLVALGLYANESFSAEKGIISNLLHAKMEYLRSDIPDVLKFDFKIKSKDGLTEIYSQYDKGSLTTKLNGEPAGTEYFNEKIQVLYDVPDDPLVKLQSSVILIRENLLDYERYLQRYHQDLEKKMTQIMDFKQKDKKIQKNRTALEETKHDLKIKKELIKRVEGELSNLETADKVISFYEINELMEEIEKNLTIKKGKRTELKKKGIGGGTPKFNKQVTEFNSINSDIKSSLSVVKKYSEVLSSEQSDFLKKVGNKLSGLYSPQDTTTKEIQNWRSKVKEIVSNLEKDPLNEQFKEEEKQSELVKKIMDVLHEYLSIEMNVPGTNTNIFSFYKDLDEFKKQIEPKIFKKRNLAKVIEELSKLSVNLSDLEMKREQIPDVEEDQMYEYSQIEDEIRKLKRQSEDLVKDSLKYEELIKSLPDEEIDEILNNPGQREQYKRTKKEFEDLKGSIAALEQKEKTLGALIEDLGELEASPAFDEKWLQEESAKCWNLLNTKVNKWKKALEPVNFRKTDSGIDYNQTKDFFDALAEYFAEILQNVYFEKKSWEVEKVDLVNRQYIVKDRKPIKFIQIGTGHTALNSILSRIKQKFGGKKKIILVDEIGHIDEENIGILVDEIKNQINKGETIFALITIADNTVPEITWEPIQV